jgi:hypothetical protein
MDRPNAVLCAGHPARKTRRRKEVPVEEERERVKAGAQDDPEVEAHRTKAGYAEGSEPPEEEAGRRETDDPDVEAHRFKSG